MTRSPLKAALFFGLVLALFLTGAGLFGEVLSRDGWTPAELLLFGVFAALFLYLAFGFSHAAVGAWIRWTGWRNPDAPGEALGPGNGRVAILMPVYNEPVGRVFRGLRSILRSVMEETDGVHFDLHILSDSNRSSAWLAEERAWLDWVSRENLQGRVFYRHRSRNHGKKAGNVADFCRERGGDYEFMVVLDADSVMTGATLCELRRRMLAEPNVALIQTMPRLVGAESLYGRLQQFSNRLYGPLFMDGLGFWQQGGGNFWGHNAIIRTEPFVRECALPELPGRQPFGGPILSHDFVEAGLLVSAGWEVRLAPELEGSYEEGPQSLIDAAARDRRWCQGNLQHSILLGVRGFRWRTKLHFLNGILGYVSSPLWLMLVVLGIPVMAQNEVTDAAPAWKLLGLTALLLFLPKMLCVLDLAFDPARRRTFGGLGRAALGAFLETLGSALIAPINMAFHTRFVLWNLLGKTVGWDAQHRGAEGTPWRLALRTHAWQVALGLGLAVLAWRVGGVPATVLASPILLGLMTSVAISVFSSRAWPSARRLFLTPEEISPPREVVAALAADSSEVAATDDLETLLADPVWNATHLALLGDAADPGNVAMDPYLLGAGPAGLSEPERMSLLSDRHAIGRLHLELWNRWPDQLAAPWREVMDQLVRKAG
ncbi:glucans biosynthesis glucosyltransferase MdoH [Haloferula sargassicola]|uniref:Glucans biosynthesis glucosyltransferase H n=1 Tax=Haloferula sargassicola TaxID=490096 RepID=A0ABP9ULI0_9BACT